MNKSTLVWDEKKFHMPPASVTVGMKYRKISPVERTYFYHDKHGDQSLIINAVLEGYGEFDLMKWQAAADKVAAAHPGTRLTKKGKLGFAYWKVGGPTIPVTLIEDSSWDGMSSENAEFLNRPLSPFNGPTYEVLLVKADKLWVVFRAHHSVSDATGLRYVINDFFRALRGNALKGSNSIISDIDIASRVTRSKLSALPRDELASFSESAGTSLSQVWRRKMLPVGNFKLLPKIFLAIKKVTERHDDRDLSIRLTVDMRRHLSSCVTSIANCTGAFDVRVSSNDNLVTLTKRMSTALREMSEAASPPALMIGLSRWVPSTLIGIKEEAIIKTHQARRYRRSGTVSKAGGMNLEECSGAGFFGQTWFALPPALKLCPFFIGLWVNDKGVEMVVAMPELLGNNGRIDAFVEDMAATVCAM